MVAVQAAGLPALLLTCLSWEILETFNLMGKTPTAGMTPAYAVYSLLTGLTSWLWVVALLCYLNEATYPA